MNPPAMIWHLRIFPSKYEATNIRALTVLWGKEAVIEPRIIELVHHELSKDIPFSSVHQLHLLRHSTEGLAPLFTVELPTTGWQFILDSRKGVTQWYVNAISENHKYDTPMIHGFFSEKLVPFGWELNNLLVVLQRAFLGLPFQNPNVSLDHGNHYIVNILLKIRGPPTGLSTKFTTHFVSADAKLVDVFEILAGGKLSDRFALVQWVWLEETEKYDVLKCNRYSEVRTQNMALKDAGWVGKEIWLFPTW